MDGSEMVQRIPRQLSDLAFAAFAILLLGCASSSPSTSQAPPETPERTLTAPASGDSQGAEGGAQGEQSPKGASEAEADEAGGGASAAQPPAGSAATHDEAVAALDNKLEDELSKFDKQMTEETRRLAEQGEAAEQAASSSTGGGSTGGSTAGETAGAEGRTGGNEETGGDSGGEVGGSGAGTTKSGRVPPDVGDGSDDDIVARQLREAAMEEDDPELREKLWEEYRKYKASLASSGAKDE